MAFQTGQATSIADLFSKLSTFAVANGWTQDHSAADRLFLSKVGSDDSVYVAFWWNTGTPLNVGIYQGNTFGGSGNAPGNSAHVDSGNGFTTAGTPSNTDFDDERYVALDDDTNTYWFFEDDDYIHVVVQRTTVSPEIFVHFGFGVLTKFDDWTGGAYVYGWRYDPAGGSSTSAIRTASTHLLDGLASGAMTQYVATVHVEGLDGQPAAGKFGIVWASTASTGNDRQSTPAARETLFGGFRGGPIAYPFGRWSSNSLKGLVPLYPIWVFHRQFSPDVVRPLGRMPAVRGVNVEFFAGGQEITVGADTWVVFPSYRQQATAGTRDQGMAYKKVVT